MSLMELLGFLAGLALLVTGAELLVRGASRLAASFGISQLIVGLTVVAFGTSSPELAVSLGSAAAGEADIALGNVVGSNIFNVLFILGITALIGSLVVKSQLVRFDVPIMIGASLLVAALALDGSLGNLDGFALMTLLVVYVVVLIRKGRNEPTEQEGSADALTGRSSHLVNIVFIAMGLGLLVLGSNLLLNAAVSFAEQLGVSQLVIGLTLVAAGTSLPEVATSVLAAVRGRRDIAVGNVVGSNVFNLLGVLGATAFFSPDGIAIAESTLRFDLPVMVAVAVACLPIFATGHLIARWEGAVFLGYYIAYASYLILSAADHAGLPAFSRIMFGFVVPITVVTLAVTVLRARRRSASV
jgi:cation:H+ antiporter